MFRKLLIVLTLLFPISSNAQNGIPVIFNQEPSRNATIASVIGNGTVYGSLADLAKVFDLRSSYNSETQRLELSTSQFTIIMTPNNPFVTYGIVTF